MYTNAECRDGWNATLISCTFIHIPNSLNLTSYFLIPFNPLPLSCGAIVSGRENLNISITAEINIKSMRNDFKCEWTQREWIVGQYRICNGNFANGLTIHHTRNHPNMWSLSLDNFFSISIKKFYSLPSKLLAN